MSHINQSFTGPNHWEDLRDGVSQAFRCGYCDTDVASKEGWQIQGNEAFVRICPRCNSPTFLDCRQRSWPGAVPGRSVLHLDADVQSIYEEARKAIAANAFTAAVMACRKILMHVAVGKGADEGLSFQGYVQWLVDEHYVPRGADGWLDYVRMRGNEANHEIVVMAENDASGVLVFTEALLRSVYELPNLVPVAEPAEPVTEP
jgi:Domain of unknown function (DUF4145)